jgi:hypothetical protein
VDEAAEPSRRGLRCANVEHGSESASYLLVIGEREALAWILRMRQMAFPPRRWAEVERLAVGDELFVLSTRNCYHSPNRDRTLVVARALVATPVKPLEPAVQLAGRSFTRGCDLDIQVLTPYRTGVELAPLIPRLDAFPRKDLWPSLLRRPLLLVNTRDAGLLRNRLCKMAAPMSVNLEDYLRSITPVRPRQRGE